MRLSRAVADFKAGTLASQPDATLLSVQAAADQTVAELKRWSAEVRFTFQDDTSVDIDAYLTPTLEAASTLTKLSEFITTTTTARYGCQD